MHCSLVPGSQRAFRTTSASLPQAWAQPGQSLYGLLWVSHGQTVNNSTEHWLYHPGPGTRPSLAGGI